MYIGAANGKLQVAQGNDAGSLFIWQDGKYMTTNFFVSGIREALPKTGLRAGDYKGHNFCVGAVITDAQQGLQDSLAKMDIVEGPFSFILPKAEG